MMREVTAVDGFHVISIVREAWAVLCRLRLFGALGSVYVVVVDRRLGEVVLIAFTLGDLVVKSIARVGECFVGLRSCIAVSSASSFEASTRSGRDFCFAAVSSAYTASCGDCPARSSARLPQCRAKSAALELIGCSVDAVVLCGKCFILGRYETYKILPARDGVSARSLFLRPLAKRVAFS